MKTTLDLPDHLMRDVKIRAARTDRKLKDMVAELIQRGLAGSPPESAGPQKIAPRKKGDALDALFAAGDDLAKSGVNIKRWAANSREVWR